MKHCIIITILFSLSLTVLSQFPRTEFVIHSGIAIPAFEFSQKNLERGSFTLPGFTAGAELKAHFRNDLGAFIQSGIAINPVDVGNLGYEKVQADPFLLDVYVRSDPFRVIHLLAGLSYQYKLLKKVTLEAQAGAGTFFSSTPYQLYKPEYFPIGPPFFEITPSHDVSFAYSLGLRAVYETNPWYQIGLSTGFKRSKAAFDFYSGSTLRTDIRNISLFDVSVTLILRLTSQ